MKEVKLKRWKISLKPTKEGLAKILSAGEMTGHEKILSIIDGVSDIVEKSNPGLSKDEVEEIVLKNYPILLIETMKLYGYDRDNVEELGIKITTDYRLYDKDGKLKEERLDVPVDFINLGGEVKIE